MGSKENTGTFGERQALIYLQNCGYQILDVNWRYKHWEADIIMRDRETLVFVEVKTRSSVAFGQPSDFVDARKEKNLFRLARVYMEHVRHEGDIRFDIISVIKGEKIEIEHIKDAFWQY